MTRHTLLARTVTAVVLVAALTACGQKGPLYLPDHSGTIITRPAGSTGPTAAPGESTSTPQAPPQSTPAEQGPAGPAPPPATPQPGEAQPRKPDDQKDKDQSPQRQGRQ